MSLNTILNAGDVALSDQDRRRIARTLRTLERRLIHHPDPTATISLTAHPRQRQVEASLRVQVGPLGSHLLSRQRADTAGLAVWLAAKDVARQLERLHAQERGEPTFGVPSRRLPAQLRPHPLPPRQPRAGAQAPAATSQATDTNE